MIQERNIINGTTAAIVAPLLEFYNRLIPFLLLAIVLIIVDSRFGVAAARKRNEPIRTSRKWRRAINKLVDYICWVNGVDVTGIDAYVERTDGWFVTSDVDPSLIHLTQGQDWNQVVPFATDYGIKPVRVHFYGNVPASGDTIQLVVGGYGWSDDGVHQTESGNQTYGSCILKAITQ